MLNSLPESGPHVTEIWSLDSADAGQSARMNAGRLGLAVAWSDQCRDMLQFLDYYLPPTGTRRSEVYPAFLPRNEKGAARKDRMVVGIGHSFSASKRRRVHGIGTYQSFLLLRWRWNDDAKHFSIQRIRRRLHHRPGGSHSDRL